MENNLTGLKTESLKLGKLLSVHHIKFGLGCLLPFALLIFPAMGLFMFLEVRTAFEKVASLIFLTVVTTPLIFAAWKILPKLKDELTIYQNGFTYKSPKGLQQCLWTEIKDGTFSTAYDGRNVMNSAVKENGEKIVFVYKMQGLDELNRFYDEEVFRQVSEEEARNPSESVMNYSPENDPGELGAQQSSYHVKYGCGQIFLHGFVFFPWALFTIGMFATGKFIILIFVIPLSILFFGMLWSTFQDRNDELTIYQNGFTYKSRKGLQTCLWNEIIASGIKGGTITDIKTSKGEFINFALAMQGLDDMTTRRNKQLD